MKEVYVLRQLRRHGGIEPRIETVGVVETMIIRLTPRGLAHE